MFLGTSAMVYLDDLTRSKEITMLDQRMYVIGKLPEDSEKRKQLLAMSAEEFETRFYTAWHYMLHECFMPELYSILKKYCTELPEDSSLVKQAERVYTLVDATDTYDGLMCFIAELIVEAACAGACELVSDLIAFASTVYNF